MIDLATARETFESSTDYTVGIEEEFALLHPGIAAQPVPQLIQPLLQVGPLH